MAWKLSEQWFTNFEIQSTSIGNWYLKNSAMLCQDCNRRQKNHSLFHFGRFWRIWKWQTDRKENNHIVRVTYLHHEIFCDPRSVRREENRNWDKIDQAKYRVIFYLWNIFSRRWWKSSLYILCQKNIVSKLPVQLVLIKLGHFRLFKWLNSLATKSYICQTEYCISNVSL